MDKYNKLLSDLRNCLKPTHDCMMCEYVDEDFSVCKNHLVSDIQKVFHEFLDLLSRKGERADQSNEHEKYENLQSIHQDLVEFCDDLMADNRALKKQVSELNHKISNLISENPTAINWHNVETYGLPKEQGSYLTWVHFPLKSFCEDDEQESENLPNGYCSCMEFSISQKFWDDDNFHYNALIDYVDKDHSFFVSHWAEVPDGPAGDSND